MTPFYPELRRTLRLENAVALLSDSPYHDVMVAGLGALRSSAVDNSMGEPTGEQLAEAEGLEAVAVLRADPSLSAEEICEGYERLRSLPAQGYEAASRRREGICRQAGIFYTPPVVAAFMVAAVKGVHEARPVDDGAQASRVPTLLDPACGAGNFLVAGARAGFRGLIGLDSDRGALAAAAIALERTGVAFPARPSLTQQDALAAPLPPAECIVANPPYVSSDTLAPQLRDELRDRFREWIKPGSKPDLYLYFLARIAIALTAHRGVASVIVPNRILTGDVAAPMRARLRPLLTEIVDVGHLSVFPAADVHPVILLLDGAAPSCRRTSFRVAVPRSLDDLALARRRRTRFRLAPRAPELWLTSCDTRLESLLRHVHSFAPLGESFRVREGLRGGARGRSRPVAEVEALPQNERRLWLPEFRGRHIRPYRVTGHEGFYPRPSAPHARPGTRLHDQLGRKAVFPELCRRIAAAIQTGHVAYGGVYYVPEREGARPLEVLVAYLCSPLATVVYRGLYAAGAWHGSLKLRTRYVERLPLPPSRRHDARLRALAVHLSTDSGDVHATRCADRLVYDLFELRRPLITLVEERSDNRSPGPLPSLAEARNFVPRMYT